MRVLFVGEGVTLAHVTRPLVLAQALDRGRHEVLFACGGPWTRFAERSGLPVHPLPTMSAEEFAGRLAVGRPVFTADRLSEYVTAELDLFERTSPELVVGDFRVSLGVSTAVAGIAYAALTNAHWSPFSIQPFPIPEHPYVRWVGVRAASLVFPLLQPSVFRLHARGFNRVRRRYGLAPVPSLREMYTYGTWTLYLDIPRLAPTQRLPGTHYYLGPVLWEPDLPLPPWWGEWPTDKPLIYVTLGSSGAPRLLRHLVEALGGLPVAAVVATAGQSVESLPPNVRIAEYLPALRVIGRAQAVVSNGGSATTYQALARGVPVLGLPSNADQYLTMEAVAREGAGILVRSGQATTRAIRHAIEGLVTEPRYAHTAKEVEREMAGYRVEERFVRFVDSVVAASPRDCRGA